LRTLTVANLHRAHRQMTLLGHMTAMEKVAYFLLDMDRHSTATDRRLVDMPMSRTDIADYLGMTIETVSRAIASLRRNGVVATVRSGFELHNRVALLELSNQSRF
jgi:CRP/FNR family transcriptional regulator, nitrogen fixation regulation protein